MTRNAGFTVENNFVNGLVTEATGLNFPENAVTDTDNCVFDSDTSFRRRNGIDLEVGYSVRADPQVHQAVSEFVWESAAGDGNLTFLVQQTGRYLTLFSANTGPAISGNVLSVLDIAPYALDYTQLISNIFQYAAGFGKLIVTHPFMDPLYIEYNKGSGAFSITQVVIQTRDFKSVQPWPVGRSSTYVPTHAYNLHNQGWSVSRQADYLSKAGFYPSDYEVWWLYKSPDALGVESFLTDVAVAAGILNNLDRGNSPAPRGSTILNEFYQDRNPFIGGGSIPITTSGINRPSTCAFHAGRAFYSGVNASEYNSKVYFTQIIEDNTQFAKCYQQNDPTSQYSSDLLPTDGGVIAIPEAGTIHKLWSIDNSLLVVASTGVWIITGSQGIGFSAIDYTVKKISSAKTLSAHSFVSVNGAPVWWGLDGILAAVPDTQLGGTVVQSVSDEKIKRYYQDIPEQSKNYAKGAFNTKDRVIQWVFRSISTGTLTERYSYNKILNFDVTTKSFYPWSMGAGVTVKGIVAIGGLGSEQIVEDVTTSTGELVVDSLGGAVTSLVDQLAQISSKFKYFVNTASDSYTYAEQDEDSYYDWTSALTTPVLIPAFIVSGFKLRGDGIKKAQSNYLRFFARDDTVLNFQARWDYATSGNTGRWSSRQLIQFDSDGYAYTTRRIKPRGHGLVFQYVLQSHEDNPMDIIGWASMDSSNERL